MTEKLDRRLKIITYSIIAVLGIAFIGTCIIGHSETGFLIAASLLLMIRITKVQSDNKESYVILLLSALIDSGIILYGSFSDNLAILLIVFACNVIELVKKGNIKICTPIWLIYVMLCEFIGLLGMIGIIQTKSILCNTLIEGVIIDIVFVFVACTVAMVNGDIKKKYTAMINTIFLAAGSAFVIGGLIYLQLGKAHYKLEELDMSQTVNGECIIKSVLLDGKVVTLNQNASDGNLILEKYNNSENQIFTFTRDERGAYTLYLEESGLAVEVEDGGIENGSNVRLGAVNGAKNQEWIVIAQEDGSYTIASLYNALRIDFDLMDVTHGINLMVYEDNGNVSQRFKFCVPNDNQILNAYMYEAGDIPFLKAFKSLILCGMGVILVAIADFCVTRKLKKSGSD